MLAKKMALWLVVALLSPLFACNESAGNRPEDSGPTIDAGEELDSGGDRGPGAEGGVGAEGGPGVEAGPGPEGGVTPDSAVAADLGPTAKVVKPQEIQTLLANPGRGWMTMFTPAINDKNIPPGVTSTLYYYRIDWADVHTGPKTFNFAGTIDAAIAKAKQGGQQIMIRLMPVWENASSPAWMKKQGYKGYNLTYLGKAQWVVDLDDKQVQAQVADLLLAMGKKYDNHPGVDSLEISFLGLYGEGHFSDTTPKIPMPTAATQKWLADQHYKSFPNTPIIGPISWEASITDYMVATHGASKGAGIFFDCWGDYSAGWSHMLVGYPNALKQGNKSAAWKRGIIKLEPCGVMNNWPNDIKKALAWAETQHASYIGNKTTAAPSSAHSDIKATLKKLGYRLVLRQLKHPPSASKGSAFTLALELENVGVAPPYHDYHWAVQLRSAAGAVASTFTSKSSVKHKLPGKHSASLAVPVPASLGPGSYSLAVGLVSPHTNKPAVQLAIKGKDSAGWYPLSSITVK